MIVKGNARGSAGELAAHLSNQRDNDRVEVVELRGVAAQDLYGALTDLEAVASGTRCREHLYSCSINPSEPITRAQYAHAIERIEDKLGLTGQPRAVVFHWKQSAETGESREHCHVVWSRIHEVEKTDRDGNTQSVMQAIPLPFDRQRLREVSRELAHDFSLTLPQGLAADRGPERFKDRFNAASYPEQGQEKRSGLDPATRKAEITAAYLAADSGTALIHALEERGYYLAQGDKRGFVVVDQALEVHALARQVEGATTKEVKAKLHPLTPEQLPTVDRIREAISRQQGSRTDLAAAYSAARPTLEAQEQRFHDLIDAQVSERKALGAQFEALRALARKQEADALEAVKAATKKYFQPEWAKLFKKEKEQKRIEAEADKRLKHLINLPTNRTHEDGRGTLAAAYNPRAAGPGQLSQKEAQREKERKALGQRQYQAGKLAAQEVKREFRAHHRDLTAEKKRLVATMHAKQALARFESTRALEAARDERKRTERERKTQEASRPQARPDARSSATPASPSRRDDWIRAALSTDTMKQVAAETKKANEDRKRDGRDGRTRKGPYDQGRTR